MKKCFVCAALLCLILVGCAAVAEQPGTTTVPQTNATTLPSSSTTTARPTTRPPTRPPTFGDPICLMGHAFENGICKNCKAKDPNHTGTYPTENFCAQGHTYAGPYCVYCLAVNPDYAKCESTHTYQNGYCIYCRAVDATFDFCAQGHTYRYGFCIYCGSTDPNYNPCAGGHVYQNGYCIYCLNQQPSAGQPTTVKPTTIVTTKVTTRPYTCGLPQCYGKGHTYENGKCIYCRNPEPNPNLSTTRPSTPPSSGTTRASSWICGTPFLSTTKTTVKPTRAIGYVEKKAGLTEVELISGDQMVIPIGKMRTANTYDESAGRWLCALGSGVKFNSMAEEDIPVLNHVTAICIGIPENAEFVGIFIQSERTEQGEQTSLIQMAELAPGTYYVKIGLNRYGDTHEGRQESYYYEYGFKLIKTIP